VPGINIYQPRAPHPRRTAAKRRNEQRSPASCHRSSDPRETPAAPGHVGIVVNPATHTMIDAYATGYDVEYDTYGLPASKGGLSPVVGFTRP
jgi:hypothetical protein